MLLFIINQLSSSLISKPLFKMQINSNLSFYLKLKVLVILTILIAWLPKKKNVSAFYTFYFLVYHIFKAFFVLLQT